jgi:uncharacterized RDD family membrane protein YckC
MKITEIPLETKMHVFEKNAMGERARVEKTVTRFKEVICVSGWMRFGHYVIDMICFYIFVFIIGIFIGLLDAFLDLNIDYDGREFDISMRVISWVFLHPFFYCFWEFFFQKTPGKWITRCRVVDEYGNKPGFKQILGRSYARAIPFEAFSCLADRGWHDTMSNTYLVSETHLAELKAIMRIDEIGNGVKDLPDDNFGPSV